MIVAQSKRDLRLTQIPSCGSGEGGTLRGGSDFILRPTLCELDPVHKPLKYRRFGRFLLRNDLGRALARRVHRVHHLCTICAPAGDAPQEVASSAISYPLLVLFACRQVFRKLS
jgi:hypothetical protein